MAIIYVKISNGQCVFLVKFYFLNTEKQIFDRKYVYRIGLRFFFFFLKKVKECSFKKYRLL